MKVFISPSPPSPRVDKLYDMPQAAQEQNAERIRLAYGLNRRKMTLQLARELGDKRAVAATLLLLATTPSAAKNLSMILRSSMVIP